MADLPLAIPRDRQEVLDELDRLERELAGLVEPIDDVRFNWRPRGLGMLCS